LCSEIVNEIALPEDCSVVGVKAEHVANCSDHVNTTVVDNRRAAWPCRVADGVSSLVGVLPDDFACRRFETQNSFTLFFSKPIHHVDASVGD
jgi:hypothetical protein